jgi:hypothetical protein
MAVDGRKIAAYVSLGLIAVALTSGGVSGGVNTYYNYNPEKPELPLEAK